MTDNSLHEMIEAERAAIKRVAQEIRSKPTVVEVAEGAVSATALPNGSVTELRISTAATQRYSSTELSELVLAAVQDAMNEAAKVELDAMKDSNGRGPGSLNDIFGDALDDLSREIIGEEETEERRRRRWSATPYDKPDTRRQQPEPVQVKGKPNPFDRLNPQLQQNDSQGRRTRRSSGTDDRLTGG